tara:strand:- start:9 stop:425 length:417 start_codon:yes stop_codon:yes gene_type:complete
MAFKMKNPSVAKLAKAAGSPMRKKLPSYDEAYPKRDLNLYGELSKEEFVREAERQKAGGKVPTKPMKGSRVKRVEPKKLRTEPPKTIQKIAERTGGNLKNKIINFIKSKKTKSVDPLNRRKKLPGRRKKYNPRLNRFE